MAYDLEEQEQLEQFKAWWNRYGNLITGIIAVVALGVLGNYAWNWYQVRETREAAAIYEQFQTALDTKNANLMRETTGQLIGKYASTAYAEMAALQAAHANVDAGDMKTAQAQLQWAADNAHDDAYRYIARLRLATVLLDQKQADAALAALAGDVPDYFASAYNDRRGDIYLSQNRIEEAKKAYTAAQDKLALAGDVAKERYEPVLKFKLDALASALPVAAAPAGARAPASPPGSPPVSAAPAVASPTVPSATPTHPASEKK